MNRTALATTSNEDSTRVDQGRAIRLDIEGMRAIAVGFVLAFHAGLPMFAGGFIGVDMFFVLSGFLITGLLAREVSRTGRVSLSRFWARRARRLLPASATVLAFSAFATWAVLPITQRAVFGGDIIASALYVVNWRFADRSVDYLAEDIGASPVQHFWSLAVEEQFYIVWPLLIVAIALISTRHWRRSAFYVLGAITIVSFVWSVMQSQRSPETAFFVSTTRIWELGIGAVLALSATAVLKVPAIVRAIGGWAGLLAITYAVLFFDTGTAWPGVNTLVPTVGCALLIASGIAPTPGGPQRMLSWAPAVWIGGLSYSLYLWHWPILIGVRAYITDLQIRYAVALMIFSIIPAWLCHKLIENPIRFGAPFKPSARALGLGAALTAGGIVFGLVLNATASATIDEASKKQSLGAAALDDPANNGTVWSATTSVDRIRPLPLDAPRDQPPLYDDQPECQVWLGDPVPRLCTFGDPKGDKTIVIVGDSKIVQWETALDTIAKRLNWRLVQITKSACPFTDAVVTQGGQTGPWEDCRTWGQAALQEIINLEPDLVLTTHGQKRAAATDPRDGLTEDAMIDGMVSYWQTIRDAGIPLVAVLDNPAPGGKVPVYECVARTPESLDTCSFDKENAVKRSGAANQIAAAERVPGVGIVDMTETICPDTDRCAAVIGNVLVYRQGSHITTTYINSAMKRFSASLFAATKGRFGEE